MKKHPPLQKAVTPTIKRLELGVLGRFFGDKDNAPVLVAGALVFLLLGLLVLVAYHPANGLTPNEVRGTLLVTLGFLFGRLGR